MSYDFPEFTHFLVSTGRVDEAIDAHETITTLYDELAERFPNDLSILDERSKTYLNFTLFALDKRSPSNCLTLAEKSIQINKELLERNPQSQPSKIKLVQSLNVCARAHTLLGNHSSANVDWDQAFAIASPSLQALIQETRVISRYKAGLVNEALSDINQLAKTAKLSPNSWYNFACYYWLASLNAKEKQKLFTDRAVALFGKAIEAGYKDQDHVEKDSDLDPIRDRVDFKSLMAKISARNITTQGLSKVEPWLMQLSMYREKITWRYE